VTKNFNAEPKNAVPPFMQTSVITDSTLLVRYVQVCKLQYADPYDPSSEVKCHHRSLVIVSV